MQFAAVLTLALAICVGANPPDPDSKFEDREARASPATQIPPANSADSALGETVSEIVEAEPSGREASALLSKQLDMICSDAEETRGHIDSATIGALEHFKKCIADILNNPSSPSRTSLGQEKNDPVKQASCLHSAPGMFVGALLKGLMEAGFLMTDETGTVQFTWNDSENGRLEVNLRSKLYGEVATSSTFPIMWALDKILTFAVSTADDPTTLTMTGFHAIPAKQGISIWKTKTPKEISKVNMANCAVEAEENCKTHFPHGCQIDKNKCQQKELKTFAKGLTSWGGSLNKKTVLPDKKLGAILHGMPTWANLAIRAAGGFDKLLYSATSFSPLSITELTFPTRSEGVARDVRMTKVVHYTEGDQDDEEQDLYKQLHRRLMLRIMSNTESKYDEKTAVAFLRACAYSNEAFYGKLMDKDGWDGKGGSLEAFINMVSFCDGPGTSGNAKTVDAPCRGEKIGRVNWAAQPGVSFS